VSNLAGNQRRVYFRHEMKAAHLSRGIQFIE